MKITLMLCLFILPVIIVTSLGVILHFHQESKLDSSCIQDSPWVVMAGYIQPPRKGTFTSIPQVHYLYYKGKFKLTGEECNIRRCVTEKEYERRMYKSID